jgi:hypothetical protein
MANSDKNIKITPNISQTAQPNVVFTGQGNIPITLKVLDDSYGTLSFEGSAGQLFSVNNNLSTGVIFSVNDISGIPQIDVNADGTIRLAPFAANVQVAGLTLGKGASGISTNTAFGVSALVANTTGSTNTAVGYNALLVCTTSGGNTAIGNDTLKAVTTSSGSNTAVGDSALRGLTTGINNTAIGLYASIFMTTATGTVSVGMFAGRWLNDRSTSLTAPNYSIYIGNEAFGFSATETNAIVIGGYQAAGRGSNTTVIGTTSTTTSYLYGETSYIGGVAGTAISIQPQTRSTTGAGANVTIAAGAGVTTGAGGSIILQPGAQATSGGNGVVIVRQPGGTAGTDEGQVYHDGTDLYIVNKEGGATSNSVRLQTNAGYGVYASNRSTGAYSCLDATSGTLLIAYQTNVQLSYWSVSGSSGAFYTFNDAYQIYWPGSGLLSNAGAVLSITGGSTSGTSTGGSIAFKSSSPSGYAANQDNLVLTGSAFQRLSASGGVDRTITGIAPPSGGSHVDGRMIRIYNVGTANNLILAHNSASSTTTNRLWCVGQANITISSYDYAELIYDSNDNGRGGAGWRVH